MPQSNADAGVIGVEAVEEHEDGSATYKFHMDAYCRGLLAEEGLKLVLYCAAAKMDMQLVYDFIEDHIRYNNDQEIRPMTDEERQAAKNREKANQKDKKGQNNTKPEGKT
jgi:hypothetical protein